MKIIYMILSSCFILISCTGHIKKQNISAIQKTLPNFDNVTTLLNAEKQINSVLISQNGNVIYEYHLTENEKDCTYNYNSVAKSITSILTGIAIDKGYIKSEDVYIKQFYKQIRDTERLKNDIQLKHLLSMTSGISWPESTEWNHFFRPMIESDNWINFIISRDMSDKPGEYFNYNSGNHHLVSKIIQDATNKNMLDFGKEHLFNKIGIESVSWYNDPQGVCFGGAWISMKPSDALKIGQLILDNGLYKDQQIVSSEWILKMTSVQSTGYKWNKYIGGEYGYGWWINNYNGCKTIFAWGANEQYIFITPSLDLVVVFNSSFRNQNATRPPQIYSDYIIKELLIKDGA